MIEVDTRVKVVEMLEAGEKPAHIARKLKIGRQSVYRIKKESEEGKLKEPKAVAQEEAKTEKDAQVIKLVPNPRLLLAMIDKRFVRVVKRPNINPKARSIIKVMEVRGDLYRMV